MAEKMELQRQRKRRVAIKDEGRRKECRTATETTPPSEKPQLDETFHRFSSRGTQSKSAGLFRLVSAWFKCYFFVIYVLYWVKSLKGGSTIAL